MSCWKECNPQSLHWILCLLNPFDPKDSLTLKSLYFFFFFGLDDLSTAESEILKPTTIIVLGSVHLHLLVFVLWNWISNIQSIYIYNCYFFLTCCSFYQ
jgi:hypothetical protein